MGLCGANASRVYVVNIAAQSASAGDGRGYSEVPLDCGLKRECVPFDSAFFVSIASAETVFQTC